MGLNIKNPEVEGLVKEVADLMGVNKTEAIRQALEEKKASPILAGHSDQPARKIEIPARAGDLAKNPEGATGETPDPGRKRSDFRV